MSRGVTFGGQGAILPAGTKLRLLRDRILLRPLDWVPSAIITVIRRGRPVRGIVEAIGPGRYYRRYRPHATDPNKRQYSERSTYIPTELRPGDIVELGGLNAFDGEGYNFPQVTIGTETFIICQEQDVCFVDESSQPTVAASASSDRDAGSGQEAPAAVGEDYLCRCLGGVSL